MDTAGYAIIIVNLVLGLGLGWPLARVLARVRAVVDGDRVAVWQVYVNIEPILAIMRRLGMV